MMNPIPQKYAAVQWWGQGVLPRGVFTLNPHIGQGQANLGLLRVDIPKNTQNDFNFTLITPVWVRRRRPHRRSDPLKAKPHPTVFQEDFIIGGFRLKSIESIQFKVRFPRIPGRFYSSKGRIGAGVSGALGAPGLRPSRTAPISSLTFEHPKRKTVYRQDFYHFSFPSF